jgi:hypothetical protein
MTLVDATCASDENWIDRFLVTDGSVRIVLLNERDWRLLCDSVNSADYFGKL